MAIRYRTPFAPEFNFIVKRPMTFNGHAYEPGEEFSKLDVGERMLRRLYDSRYIDAVIPSLMLREDQGEAETEVDAVTPAAAAPAAGPAKPKGRPKRNAQAQPASAATKREAAPARYRIEENFGVYRIYDGENLVRECADLDEAKAAMAELSEG